MPPPVAIPRRTPTLGPQGSYGSHWSGGSYDGSQGHSRENGMGLSLGSGGGGSWGSLGERTSSAQRIREDRRERSHSRDWPNHRVSSLPMDDVEMGPQFGAVDSNALLPCGGSPFPYLHGEGQSAGSPLAASISPGGGAGSAVHQQFMMMMDDDMDDGMGDL